MQIGVLKERRAGENRVAASPDTVKKFTAAGCKVVVETGAGAGSQISDALYQEAGATIAPSAAAAAASDLVIKIQKPMTAAEGTDEIGYLKSGAMLMCHLNALTSKDLVQTLARQGVTAFALELMPRISRAQAMDILSSQSNLAGYKAVVDAAATFGRAMPMMMTAAGTIAPARVMIFGVGVAGLQAIATARRLGAVVSATDVRPATKEQVESLGGTFVAVMDEEFQQAQTSGGYAKEMSDAYKQKQAALIAETIKKQDIAICTALIPGRPAPTLITEEMMKSMKPGSVIVDLAVENGGNCPLSELGKVVVKHGVSLVGYANVPSRIAVDATAQYARNLFNFLGVIVDKKAGALTIDPADEIIKGVMLTRDGAIVHPAFAGA